mgnify:CR=1 FL=1
MSEKRSAVFDIEANGLTPDKMWCAVVHCLETKETKTFSDYSEQTLDGGSQDFLKHLSSFDTIIGHNIIGYDLPVLKDLFGYEFKGNIVDTLILSKLLHFTRFIPKAAGNFSRHSLATWGVRVGHGKPTIDQWEIFEEAMMTRCDSDVIINTKTYFKLLEEISQQPGIETAIKIEHDVAHISQKQIENGWRLDQKKLHENVSYLTVEIERLREELEPMIPLKLTPKDPKCSWKEANEKLGNIWTKVPMERKDHLGNPIKPTRKPHVPKILKDGKYDRFTARWFGIPQEDAWGERTIGGPITRVEFKHVKLSQHALIKEYLLKLGWKPTQWTFKKGRDGKILRDEKNQPLKNSPKITEDSFDSMPGKFGSMYARWATLVHRLNTLKNPRDDTKGWINAMRPDGRVSCIPDTLGAATGRMTHKNLVNVPGVRSVFGKEMRECWIAEEGKTLVGADAAGAQLRLLAAAMGDEEYLETVVSGAEEDDDGKFIGTDIHTVNGLAAGLIKQSDVDWLRSHEHDHPDFQSRHDVFVGNRGKSKNFIYGFLFGAGAPKLGLLVDGGAKEGQEMKDKFLAGVPKLGALINSLNEEFEQNKKQYREGFIEGLDGRRVYVDSKHKLLNYLLQGNEAVFIKVCMVLIDNLVKKNNVDFTLTAVMHDEINGEVYPKDVEKMHKIMKHSFQRAGKVLGLKCPMDTSPLQGDSWYDIH